MNAERNNAQPPEEPDYTAMSDGELLDALGDDAYKWAGAFCQIKRKMGWKDTDIDFDLMLTWFANAIEGSHDVREQRMLDAAAMRRNALPRIMTIEMPEGPAGDRGQVGWMGGEYDR